MLSSRVRGALSLLAGSVAAAWRQLEPTGTVRTRRAALGDRFGQRAGRA